MTQAGSQLPAGSARLPDYFYARGESSFSAFVAAAAPHLLPAPMSGAMPTPVATTLPPALVPHGTTIVAATFAGGVVVAGDRRATAGNVIAQRDVRKVTPVDEFSVVGIAGVAGLALDLVRLFGVELEHFEKTEDTAMSFDGKVNRLGTLLRANLSLAMSGLPVIPLFAGFNLAAGAGRIVSYDATGGHYEAGSFYSVGSGAEFARGSLKKLYAPDLSQTECVTAVIQALFDAADEDSATAGADLGRKIYPTIHVVTADGHDEYTPDQAGAVVAEVVAGRLQRPDGPRAPLHQDRLQEEQQ